jgi:hypothetical protein
MTNQQQPQLSTHAKQEESLFRARMIWIMHETCLFIQKDRSGFFKRDTTLPHILTARGFVPDEAYILYNPIVYTLKAIVNMIPRVCFLITDSASGTQSSKAILQKNEGEITYRWSSQLEGRLSRNDAVPRVGLLIDEFGAAAQLCAILPQGHSKGAIR